VREEADRHEVIIAQRNEPAKHFPVMRGDSLGITELSLLYYSRIRHYSNRGPIK
jgi:hypothetical protein